MEQPTALTMYTNKLLRQRRQGMKDHQTHNEACSHPIESEKAFPYLTDCFDDDLLQQIGGFLFVTTTPSEKASVRETFRDN